MAVNVEDVKAIHNDLNRTSFITKRPKTIAELRKMIGVKPAFDVNLVDLAKEGR